MATWKTSNGVVFLVLFLPLFPLESSQQNDNLPRKGRGEKIVVACFERIADRVQNFLMERGAPQHHLLDWF